MSECQNCGSHVTEDYIRVWSRRGEDTVYCCPHCEDRVRRNGNVDAARGERRQGNAEFGETANRVVEEAQADD